MTAATQSQRIADIEARGTDTIVLACLLTFMRWRGFRGRLINVLGLAPMTPGSGAGLQFACRQLGLSLQQLAQPLHQQSLPDDSILLLCWADGRAMLAVARASGVAILFDPCSPPIPPWQALPAGAVSYLLEVSDRRRWARPRARPPRLWLVDYRPHSPADLDMDAIGTMSKRYAAACIEEREPNVPVELTTAAVLACHESMAPAHPAFFGCLRTLNIRQYSVFVDAADVPRLLDALLVAVARGPALVPEGLLPFAARVLTDFLTIHPFLNGNRRVALALVSAMLHRHDLKIYWDQIGVAAFYYAMRCAARGHFGPLLSQIRSHLKPETLHG
ncbi:hypothetical protein ASF61_04455 [Duganella sp. Leaf126]|uniref:Fic family protein n=1 Tax=Duganella sp. Leaf126 TaxID=1736266 RepID=UPI0006F565A3|nr:Fic family protein [Duganella sp. Leaf126]KQQ40056.1 hypothetical protein ASF61_04455 [Duganella sp. Leaf126]